MRIHCVAPTWLGLALCTERDCCLRMDVGDGRGAVGVGVADSVFAPSWSITFGSTFRAQSKIEITVAISGVVSLTASW